MRREGEEGGRKERKSVEYIEREEKPRERETEEERRRRIAQEESNYKQDFFASSFADPGDKSGITGHGESKMSWNSGTSGNIGYSGNSSAHLSGTDPIRFSVDDDDDDDEGDEHASTQSPSERGGRELFRGDNDSTMDVQGRAATSHRSEGRVTVTLMDEVGNLEERRQRRRQGEERKKDEMKEERKEGRMESSESAQRKGQGRKGHGEKGRKRRKKSRLPKSWRSLSIVLSSCMGMRIVVEGKRGEEISGIVEEVDEYMK